MTSVVRLVDCPEAAAPVPELEAVAGRSLAAVQGQQEQGQLIMQTEGNLQIEGQAEDTNQDNSQPPQLEQEDGIQDASQQEVQTLTQQQTIALHQGMVPEGSVIAAMEEDEDGTGDGTIYLFVEEQ